MELGETSATSLLTVHHFHVDVGCIYRIHYPRRTAGRHKLRPLFMPPLSLL